MAKSPGAKPVTSNPASRLHAVLSSIGRRQPTEKMQSVWASVFHVDAKDTGEIFRRLAVLPQQVQAAMRQVEEIPGIAHRLHLGPLQKVEAAVSLGSLTENFETFSKRLGAATVSHLEYTADLLRQHTPVTFITPDDQNSLLDKVQALAKDIRASGIEHDLKLALTEYIERIRRALIEYDLRGPEGVMEALDQNVGFLARSVDNASPAEKSAFEKVRAFLGAGYEALVRTAGAVKAGKELAEHIPQLPPPPM